jgi:hypothetical protein
MEMELSTPKNSYNDSPFWESDNYSFRKRSHLGTAGDGN